MAEDCIVLLNYVGWTEKRDIHVVGLSLGGMIAQELAYRIPERIISLTLGVTTPGGRPWSNFPPWKGVISLTRLTFLSDPAQKMPIILDMVYYAPWLDEKAENDPAGRTNRVVETENFLKRAAITPPQTMLGSFSQMSAGLTHHVSPERLRRISSSIPKVLIVTGDDDNLVHPRNSRKIKASMPEAEYVEWENTGHALHGQRLNKFHALLERVFAEGEARMNG